MTPQLREHLERDRYGSFWLTNAIRPAPKAGIIPEEGYLLDTYNTLPCITAAVSREKLFDVFNALLEELSPVVNSVLETSHETDNNEHTDLYRDSIDRPILQSYLLEYEDLLMNDGRTGVAILSQDEQSSELQFDEHKLLVIYTQTRRKFIHVLREFGLQEKSSMKFITQGEHLHSTDSRYWEEFQQLASIINATRHDKKDTGW